MENLIPSCFHCESENIVKSGKHPYDRQRLLCKNCGRTFQEEYTNLGAKPETKGLILSMHLNGSSARGISRTLGVSQNTVLALLKKLKPYLEI